jgi:aspartate aminotransferase
MSVLSKRATSLKPSATLAITAKAKQMRAEGVDVIGFGAGEPDFATPSHIIDAAVESLQAGDTHYTPVGGTPQFKQAIADAVKRDYGLEYQTNCVTASCGAKHTLFNLFMSILDEGDEVIIPAPYWVSYPEQVALAGGTPVIMTTREEDGFVPNPEELEKLITPKTKALVLNSPSNPTGAMYSRGELEKLAEVARRHNFLIVSDDIYHKLVYDGAEFCSILHAAPDLMDRVVIVNGVSKTYAMTGWRLGYALGPVDIISAMEKLQGQSTSNPTSFAQKGAIEALVGDQSCIDHLLAIFKERRNLLVEGLNEMELITCRMPVGAFYAFPNISGIFGKKTPAGTQLNNSIEVAQYLLDEARIAVVPGGPFGADANVRMSYATSEDSISLGLARMSDALDKLI